MPEVATGDASARATVPSRSDPGLGVLRDLFAEYHPRDFDVRLWDGTVWPAETDETRFTLTFTSGGAGVKSSPGFTKRSSSRRYCRSCSSR